MQLLKIDLSQLVLPKDDVNLESFLQSTSTTCLYQNRIHENPFYNFFFWGGKEPIK